jgi:hypothetical protein
VAEEVGCERSRRCAPAGRAPVESVEPWGTPRPKFFGDGPPARAGLRACCALAVFPCAPIVVPSSDATSMKERQARLLVFNLQGNPMWDRIRSYGQRLIDALYGATVASVFALCGLGLLLAIVAMAVNTKMINVQQIHVAP